MNYIKLFKKSVQKNANKIALVHKGRKISYKELDILSSKIADKLNKMGAKKGDFITINLPRSIEYVASYLGVLKAGMAVVPLSQKYPKERSEFIIKDCDAFMLIDTEFFADIDKFEFYENLAADDAPAVIYYTSGSTGAPKGILHSNASLSAATKRILPLLADFKGHSFASVCEFSFALFFVDYFAGLCGSLEIHIVPDEMKLEPKLLQKYYKTNEIYGAMLPPSLLALFRQKPALKVLYTAGERLSSAHFKGIKLYNFYGMSECFVITSFKVEKKYDNTPIGKGVKDAQILVFDENNKECKAGQTGQVVIKGDFKAWYFKDDEKSAQTFVKKGAKTLIFTGDLGYKNKNGDIIITGRKDWMVKIHGQRVEIFEIENVLKNIQGVKECAIKAFGDSKKYLVGFVASKDLSAEYLRNELTKKLPEYMLPKYFVFMDALPKNINGKIDRKALIEAEFSGERKDFIAPKSADEKELCEIFASVLKCKKVGLNDDFTLLGGDSLSAGQIASISKLKGINPSLILKEKTPANIIKACDKLKNLAKPKNKSVSLNPTQLITCHTSGTLNRSFYFLPFYIKLPKNINIKRFKNALNSTFLAHKIFCARIKKQNSKLKFVYKKESLKLEFQKIQNIEKFVYSFIKPFDLERDRLYKFCICENKSGEFYFVFSVHHSIFDGISLRIFLSDISKFYNDKNYKTKPELLAFSPTYLKLLEKRQKDSFAHKIKYLNSAIKAEILNQKNNEFISAKSLENSKEIFSFLEQNKITPDSFFMSIFAIILCQMNNTNECEITYATTSRHHKDLQNSIGAFFELFPVHFEVSSLKALCAQKELYSAHGTFLSTLKADSTNASFVYENDIFDDINFDEKKIKINSINLPFSVKIHLMAVCKNGKFELVLHYEANMYSKKFAQDFLEEYALIIDDFLKGKREI